MKPTSSPSIPATNTLIIHLPQSLTTTTSTTVKINSTDHRNKHNKNIIIHYNITSNNDHGNNRNNNIIDNYNFTSDNYDNNDINNGALVVEDAKQCGGDNEALVEDDIKRCGYRKGRPKV